MSQYQTPEKLKQKKPMAWPKATGPPAPDTALARTPIVFTFPQPRALSNTIQAH